MRTALLIIDIFNTFEFVRGDKLREEAKKIVEPILILKDFAEQRQYPILYVNDTVDPSLSVSDFTEKFFQSADSTFLLPLKPKASELFLFKEKFSAFFRTELAHILREKQIQRLILTGLAGHICVLFTANDAYMLGYQLVTPIDAYACGGEIQKCFTDEMFRSVFKSQLQPAQKIILEL